MTNDQPVTRAEFEALRHAVGYLYEHGAAQEMAPGSAHLDHAVRCLRESREASEAHRTAGDECVWPTCQGDAMAPHAPADCTCDPNYEPAYTHQSSYDRGWQDAMGATLRAVSDTPAGQFRDDVWLLVWCLNSGWGALPPDKSRHRIVVDDDRYEAIQAACDRLTRWYRNPVDAKPTDPDPGHGDAVRATLERVLDRLNQRLLELKEEGISRPHFYDARAVVETMLASARLEAEGRQP